jgi:hypothetical protein
MHTRRRVGVVADRLANYEPVQARIQRFWADHELGRIDCELLERDDKHVIAKASIWRVIGDIFPAAVGYAAEVHDGSPVNRQGWMLENAETSAIGRALANMGYAPNNARPSAEDMHRVEARDRQSIADQHLAAVTFDRLKLVAGTPEADTLKAFAKEHDRKLTLAALAGDPEWRITVDNHLNEQGIEAP